MQIADIITEYGAYYLNSGQNMASLYEVARQPFVSEAEFTPVVTDDTIWRAAKTTVDSLVQPFQKQFTPRGTVTVTPLEIRQYHMKVDTQEWPDDLEASWLGFLADGKLKRSEWPFIRWYLEKKFFPQIAEDMELKEFGRGVYAAPTAGTAGLTGTSMDGYLTTITKQITANKITPIAMGAIPTGLNADKEFVDYVEEFSDQITEVYRNKAMSLRLSEDLMTMYQRGELEKYGKNTVAATNGLKVRFRELTIKAMPSHGTSKRIWATPRENMVVLKKKTQNQKLVDVQLQERLVKFLTDWWTGVGFILPDVVFCNDQA
ncbi:hypothetical protein F5984_20560 [Rudanella paleaurantiibacter]|uniref:Phage major capsid protein n=1 Tax=Rudanella paleaurantiibacter TaxID=2614655 RepID=A0A7J5TVF9_9BACT|nr:hypothetical protein [Rudanella paleaurantiibacter]KAB7728140.1 hypothetical protein F5984_20560 [Rudanella paleaurantiibacter]